MENKAVKVFDNLYWVGALDTDLRVFDIIMHTPFGTSYNSFLLTTSAGNILIETVKEQFAQDCITRVKDVIGNGKLDYIICNHTEPDHSGSLVEILEEYPEAIVVATKPALANIEYIGHIKKTTRTIDTTKQRQLRVGEYTLNFHIQPFLHWPDTMMTVIQEMKVVLPCDVFGAHCADSRIFNDMMEDRIKDLDEAYKHYFDCIFGPYKSFVLKGIEMMETKFGFPVEEIRAICCSHGPVLRTHIKENIERYRQWAQPPLLKDQVVIAYGSAYGYTEMMAKKISEGVERAGASVKMHNIVTSSVEEVLKDFEESKGMLLGTPTLVGEALPPMYIILAHLNPIVHCSRYVQCFGSYGWSCEGVTNLEMRINQLTVRRPVKPIAFRFKPTEENLKECEEWGYQFGNALVKGL
ncbi:type A flavoprotein fprA, putative [Entamoeba invadens IP1]|uniref:Type A flavoprotein fprA, putative n=1 Tax=Entamoeba invadens IP1 TaxID=370355 RepID=A0A0A1UDJ0_ENTIV|nr:type A flavoprotein fprA, putative [Entamoeba invadens IP1]ELP94637.1 type A flavoprotein fprA, putative [Entamoeba invadens IP1]|eukprot:XP_004261408.1 type A flavoprotein fprA, putative [Entamoeba invadens IP1]